MEGTTLLDMLLDGKASERELKDAFERQEAEIAKVLAGIADGEYELLEDECGE